MSFPFNTDEYVSYLPFSCMPILLGSEASLPSRQLTSRMLQAARILCCQGLPRRGALCIYFRGTFFIFLLFSAWPLADQLFWSLGVWAKVVGFVWQGGGDGNWGRVVIQKVATNLFFVQTSSDLFVFVVSNYALLPRPGRLWNTQLDSHRLLQRETIIAENWDDLLRTSLTQAESFLLMSWLTQGREGHVGMYSAGLVVLQLWTAFQSRDTITKRAKYTYHGDVSALNHVPHQNTTLQYKSFEFILLIAKEEDHFKTCIYDLKSQSNPTTCMWIL